MGGDYGPETYSYDPATGNLASKAGVTYGYAAQSSSCPSGALSKAHAVTSAGSNTYCYDLITKRTATKDGNMERRVIGGSTYNLTYDAESRLVTVSGAVSATFVYDGDGQRVKGTVSGVTTTYIGNYFEWSGSTSTMKKYYYAGSTRVAMRTGSSTLNYLLSDHLGSTAITTNSGGGLNAELRYKAWGEVRFTSGTTLTTYRFTGQRAEDNINLYWYNSRWYDPVLGRWIQPDSIVPEDTQGVQAWDRFAYVNNNPVRFNDPTGHVCNDPEAPTRRCEGEHNHQTEKVRSQRPPKPPFDASLGGNNKNWDQELNSTPSDSEGTNPPIAALVTTGVLLTSASLVIEGVILYAEVSILPTAAVTTPVTIGLELILTAAGLAILDVNVAYWAYAARVIDQPDVKQDIELLPPWGFGK
jgi:RHS repeat-associated protein